MATNYVFFILSQIIAPECYIANLFFSVQQITVCHLYVSQSFNMFMHSSYIQESYQIDPPWNFSLIHKQVSGLAVQKVPVLVASVSFQ